MNEIIELTSACCEVQPPQWIWGCNCWGVGGWGAAINCGGVLSIIMNNLRGRVNRDQRLGQRRDKVLWRVVLLTDQRFHLFTPDSCALVWSHARTFQKEGKLRTTICTHPKNEMQWLMNGTEWISDRNRQVELETLSFIGRPGSSAPLCHAKPRRWSYYLIKADCGLNFNGPTKSNRKIVHKLFPSHIFFRFRDAIWMRIFRKTSKERD